MRGKRPESKLPTPAGGKARRRLAGLLGLAAAVGTAGSFLAGQALLQDDGERPVRLQALEASAHALAASADAEITRHATVAAALAASPVLKQPAWDLQALDGYARAAALALGHPLVVADTSLAQLVNTAVPFGIPLPALDETSAALRALEYDSVAVTTRPSDADEELSTIAIAVAAEREGKKIGVVTTRIEALALRHVLDSVAQAGMVAILVDRSGHFISSIAQPPGTGFSLRQFLDGMAFDAAKSGSRTAADGTSVDYVARPLRTVPEWSAVAIAPASGSVRPVATASFVGASLAALATFLAASLVMLSDRRSRISEADLSAAEKARLTALVSEAEALRHVSELRSLHDTIPVGLALLDRDLCFLSVNAKLAGVSGVPDAEHIGRRPSDVLPPSIAVPLENAHSRVLVSGRPVLEVPLSGEAPGTVRNTRHLLASCHPVRDSQGRISSVSMVLQDVTERVRAETGRELLVRELNHRVKNMLATVQSIVSITLRRGSGDPKHLGAELNGRLATLARAHDLLTEHAWAEADLVDVAQAALKPWLSDLQERVSIEGPRGILLRPKQAQATVLALHELATNATKYGALSQDEGCISLRWHTDTNGLAVMEWTETGGPPVIEPPVEKRGFGTRLLERALASDLGAGTHVRLTFAPEGLQARISFIGAAGPPEVVAA
ncbi:sensor histidine kinase [Teichococcus oryzae]|uniref:histidine kinase n=1 Tax=Teichococcus oryzae TaxID=1608942 RepID=A0A5B2TGJ8_9PROT|nr:HWE histidine kinase domain-containing protein [Pseudoroseomonas oryzae]KAA2213602.1 PAS domain-containing protein [Pseudoroseomonas oryzae]